MARGPSHAKLNIIMNCAINLPPIPPPAERRIALRISSGAERALRKGHPWLFADAIQKQSHEGSPGDLAVVFDHRDKFLAIGLFDPTSPIRVRILQHRQAQKIDSKWFANKIKIANLLRDPLFATNTNGYRLINGENDNFPGMVVDRYAQSLVVKIYTSAWIPHLPVILPILLETQNPERVILRLSRELENQTQYLNGLQNKFAIAGSLPEGPICFQENGITFEADLLSGQKTGFFLDQRENRARVGKISQGKKVLNVFSYTGGFSVYAARGGATQVFSLDQSRPALAVSLRNFSYNSSHPKIAACQHQVIEGDAFERMEIFPKHSFDIVIIDPPSFAKNQSEIQKGLAAYQRLTRLGLTVLKPGGILVQASCSSRIRPEDFFKSIHQTAQQMGRPLTEIERTGHALDHPVTFPEGEYLKCLFARG